MARLRAVTLAQAAQQPLIAYDRKEYPEYYDTMEKSFLTAHTRLRIAEEHDSVTSLIAAVESGRGVALVPSCLACMVGPRLKLLDLNPALDPIVVGAAWRKEATNPLVEKFLAAARQ